MAKMNHRFITRMRGVAQDKRNLYILMDYLQHGELLNVLKQVGRMNTQMVKFYAAQVVLMFEYMHGQDLIYRDLKPENVLLDQEGYLKLTDFGLSKVKQPADGMTNTFCGTPEYLAPEVILSKGHSFAVDWWSLGMLTYEMISGINPFKQQAMKGNKSRHEILQKITTQDIDILPGFSKKAGDLLRGLLTRDPNQRITTE